MVKMNEKLRWQAEDDATTMANYEELLKDNARVRRAVKVAQNRANELSKRADLMGRVAKFKNGGKMKAKKK